MGTSNKLSKEKSDVWDDTETTISVNWAGGGTIKPADEKWDLKTVVDVATRFPHLVQTCAQRTSAILTRYTSLRSFNETNARFSPEDRFKILDYDLCGLYTQDLFSAFMAYKNIWAELTDMLKDTEQYRERDPHKEELNPIQLTPKTLNEARLLARKGMTQITDETKRLITEPSLADLDEKGQQRPLPYLIPGELRRRMPVSPPYPSIYPVSYLHNTPMLTNQIRHHGLTIREQASLTRRDTNFNLLSGAEISKIGHWARDADLEFSPLIGDHIPDPSTKQHSPSLFAKNRHHDTLFCTLEAGAGAKQVAELAKLRFHGHEDRSINWLGWLGKTNRSKRCHGRLAAIAYSTAADLSTGTPPPRADGVHRVLGSPNPNHLFWSQPLADFRHAKARKLRIEFVPGTACGIAGLAVLGEGESELTGWKAWGEGGKLAGLRTVVQEVPDERSGWVLVGLWGHWDGLVVHSVGAIWRK